MIFHANLIGRPRSEHGDDPNKWFRVESSGNITLIDAATSYHPHILKTTAETRRYNHAKGLGETVTMTFGVKGMPHVVVSFAIDKVERPGLQIRNWEKLLVADTDAGTPTGRDEWAARANWGVFLNRLP